MGGQRHLTPEKERCGLRVLGDGDFLVVLIGDTEAARFSGSGPGREAQCRFLERVRSQTAGS